MNKANINSKTLTIEDQGRCTQAITWSAKCTLVAFSQIASFARFVAFVTYVPSRNYYYFIL